jgi:hypothetical protein
MSDEVEERYYLDELKDPFPLETVKYRQGPQGKQLAYIDARDVADRLDEVVGQASWQNRYICVNGVTVCEIGIKTDGEWTWKSDGAPETTIEAEKGALSDAFKRAGVKWGIARYLYDEAPPPPQESAQPQPQPQTQTSDAATEAQMRFLAKLLSSMSDTERSKFMDDLGPSPAKKDVSAAIDRLKARG